MPFLIPRLAANFYMHTAGYFDNLLTMISFNLIYHRVQAPEL